MMKEQLSELIEIINDAEDVINGGWKSIHPELAINEKQRLSPDSLDAVAAEINTCTKCGLCSERINPVPGEGVINPAVMFIGEGPGAEEDKTGIPFVGKAGQYLEKWVSAIGLKRDENCFIGNIIKCRPPGNRDPFPEEIAACRPYLLRQLQIINPTIIITLGRFASQVICGSEDGIGKLRGRTHSYNGIPVVPTYHPSAVLRDPDLRGAVWADLKRAKDLLNER
jgi:DNA polymerase